MTDPRQSVGRRLQSAYDDLYSDAITAWRELGGKYKARNILDVCQGRTFSRALDCGAGEGSVLKFLEEAGIATELFAIDISDSGIAQINARDLKRLQEARKFDGYEIPYPDQYFGMAYCTHVIEHVEHPRVLLRELKRVSEYQVFEVPLDYSVSVDRDVQHFLSYGHINIYTPSLFRFLLKSEGFEILAEALSHTAEEVLRFDWHQIRGRQETFRSKLRLKTRPMRQAVKRFMYGRRRYDEFGYSAYTCLTRSVDELRVF